MSHCSTRTYYADTEPLDVCRVGDRRRCRVLVGLVKRIKYLEQCRIANAELRKANTPCRSYWYGDDGGDLAKRKYDYRQCF